MRDGVLAEQALIAVTAIGELTLDDLAVVGSVTPGVDAVGERPQCRTVLRSEHHHDVGIARRDGAGELGDHMLRPLSPNRFQHRAGRCRPHPSGHRSRIVGRSAQWCHASAGDLELPQAYDGVDGTGDRRRISPGVGQCGPGRRRRQFHRGHAPVRRIVDPLSELTNADEYRRARINRWNHSPFRIARAKSAVAEGVLPTLTPAASSASCLAAAVPDEPDTIAPAWPMVLPSGAVKPAT